MITVQQASVIGARLARIESACVETKGMLHFLAEDKRTPPEWISQLRENCEKLGRAIVDVAALESEVLR